MGEIFKDVKIQGNRRKQFVFVAKSCVCFQSFRIHNNMSVESVIEKLQGIVREKEAQRSEHS
jgi:uncharacterized membrane protein